mmetsp:Transcript_8924/g.25919  ORF Transcript_8924/g.25919 Transcript_8924/m.25919 type:complete len:675 (+) Transcript_8924:204-2228(+)
MWVRMWVRVRRGLRLRPRRAARDGQPVHAAVSRVQDQDQPRAQAQPERRRELRAAEPLRRRLRRPRGHRREWRAHHRRPHEDARRRYDEHRRQVGHGQLRRPLRQAPALPLPQHANLPHARDAALHAGHWERLHQGRQRRRPARALAVHGRAQPDPRLCHGRLPDLRPVQRGGRAADRQQLVHGDAGRVQLRQRLHVVLHDAQRALRAELPRGRARRLRGGARVHGHLPEARRRQRVLLGRELRARQPGVRGRRPFRAHPGLHLVDHDGPARGHPHLLRLQEGLRQDVVEVAAHEGLPRHGRRLPHPHHPAAALRRVLRLLGGQRLRAAPGPHRHAPQRLRPGLPDSHGRLLRRLCRRALRQVRVEVCERPAGAHRRGRRSAPHRAAPQGRRRREEAAAPLQARGCGHRAQVRRRHHRALGRRLAAQQRPGPAVHHHALRRRHDARGGGLRGTHRHAHPGHAQGDLTRPLPPQRARGAPPRPQLLDVLRPALHCHLLRHGHDLLRLQHAQLRLLLHHRGRHRAGNLHHRRPRLSLRWLHPPRRGPVRGPPRGRAPLDAGRLRRPPDGDQEGGLPRGGVQRPAPPELQQGGAAAPGGRDRRQAAVPRRAAPRRRPHPQGRVRRDGGAARPDVGQDAHQGSALRRQRRREPQAVRRYNLYGARPSKKKRARHAWSM